MIRNRVLALIFKDMGLTEAWGGMMKIREQIKDYPEIAADFFEPGYAFQVHKKTVRHPARNRTTIGQLPDKLSLLKFCEDKMMAFLNLKHRETFTHNYYLRSLMNDLIAMTIPGKPNSPKQKYHITSG